jgi:hypothetical protein
MRGTDLRGACLQSAYLDRANLLGADLSYAIMDGASLKNANLRGAYLRKANLRGVDLREASLQGADLQGADLNRANLNATNLTQTNLSETNLSRANLSGAATDGTIFAYIDLRETRGLVKISHRGPSAVALNTIPLPQDGSTIHFLRGAGVPDEWIDGYRAHMMHPIQYYSCFISYSSKDETLAKRLHADFQDQGVRCWFAPHDMKISDNIRSRIDEAIHVQEKLLLLISEHSLTSQWVEQEVETALEKERKEHYTVLFPIRLDNTVMEMNGGWPVLIRNTRHIGDFTCWKEHDAYQQGLERLLRDLKAEA